MAPAKSTRTVVKQENSAAIPTMLSTLGRKGLTKRSVADNNTDHSQQHQQPQQQQQQNQNMDIQVRGKRKAENSPMKYDKKIKRSALGNLTNNTKMSVVDQKQQPQPQQQKAMDENAQKQIALKNKDLNIDTQTQTQVLKEAHSFTNSNKNNTKKQIHYKMMTRAALAMAARNIVVGDVNASIMSTAPVKKQKKDEFVQPPAAPVAQHAAVPALKLPTKPTRRISNEFNKTEDSLYMSALEDMSCLENSRLSGNYELGIRITTVDNKKQLQKEAEALAKTEDDIMDVEKNSVYVDPPAGVEDFDKMHWKDQYQVSQYAMDIFNYIKSREEQFLIEDYMKRQIHLSKWMRSLLVDWMVEVQETFELNHETLYLAVKIVDRYLCRVIISREKLQLLGAAALFIACKFDERTPPLVEDFLYICDGAYKHNELLKMEKIVLRTIDFDLGIPLSYRFLRRYARCARIPLTTLTLARYILELSLMDYATVSLSDSRLACAALYIALRMNGGGIVWNTTLEYYSGFKLSDFAFMVPILNTGLHRKPKATVKTIFSKYSHKIFHEVAKIPLISTEKLFEQNLTAKEIKVLLLEEKNANKTL